jgi:hypothetical protein
MAATAVLIAAGLLATVDAPGRTAIPASPSGALLHCLRFGAIATVPVLIASVFALRRLYPMGSARVAAALGATGGAIGGLGLHFICPNGGGLHVGLGHAGGMVVGAALGVLALTRFIRG